MPPKRKRNSSRKVDDEWLLGHNSIEDVTWLCSLSESELDLLISLKMMVIQRAKMIGYDELAQKFDLKMLRALGLILMEFLKEKVKDKSFFPNLAESVASLDCCNLIKCHVEEFLCSEEINECIGPNSRKTRTNSDRRPEN